MQDIYYPEKDQISLSMKETFYGFTLALKKYHLFVFLKTKDVTKEPQCFIKKSTCCRYTFSKNIFLGSAVPCGSQNSHNVVQLNPDKDKYYLLTPYPTLTQPLKKFSAENFKTIARKPNIKLQSIGIYSKSDIQHTKFVHNSFKNYLH